MDDRVRVSGGFDSQRYAVKVARPASLSVGLNSLASHQKVQDDLDQMMGARPTWLRRVMELGSC